MAVEIGDGGLGRIYLGDILIAGKPVTPPEEKYTATISWTETSDPSAINITYGGDAAGRTKGSNCWDKLFGYSAVLVDGSGNITKEVTQEDSGGYGCLNMCCLGTLSGGGNVMIKFPRMGYKMSKSGSTITACLTRCAGVDGYRYYAFNRGNGNLSYLSALCCGCYCACYTQPYMLLGAYKSSLSGGVSKSWSGCTPDYCKTIDTFRNCSMANGTNYQQIGHWQRDLINLYYVAKYGNLNSQATVGCGYVNGSCRVSTGGTNSQPSATYGTQSGTQQAKLFGLEDRRGNEYERVDGHYGRFVETTNAPTCLAARGTSGVRVDSGVSDGSKSGWISGIAGTDLGMFTPTCFSGSGNTYYSDCGDVCSSRVADAGGRWCDACSAGAFRLLVNYSPSSCGSSVGSRLMYL